ncbi:MAG: hypothetical protein IPM29_06870 [Planctomycetes bacterium]|nr:hypothetical protein [Planctomycetota bacterium]
MRTDRLLLGVLAVALAAVLVVLWRSHGATDRGVAGAPAGDAPLEPERAPPRRVVMPTDDHPAGEDLRPPLGDAPDRIAIEVDPTDGRLIRADNRWRAGERRSVTVAPVDAGIRCPDGTCLPLLNGVDSAPAMIRAEEAGPLAPVVAIVTDADGWDWYVHADDSLTTSRPQLVDDQSGQRQLQVVTLHHAQGSGSVREVPLGTGEQRR